MMVDFGGHRLGVQMQGLQYQEWHHKRELLVILARSETTSNVIRDV